MCGTSICAVLLWLVGFFGACFVSIIDDLSLAAAVGGIAILDENIRSAWNSKNGISGPYNYISDHQHVLLPPRAHPDKCMTTVVNMQITQTTLQPCPAAQAAAAGNIMRVCGISIRGVLLLWLCATYSSVATRTAASRCVGSYSNFATSL